MLNATNTRNRSPFTPTQWQELEHQALIYKYMVSGVPIPPELICSIKRSLESSLASRLFPHQPLGWGCFQVGFGRKADPEPGRCRRTDGKKWRCSKEAHPDSKYCERHMHRGRNRSRKPVELTSTTTAAAATSTVTNPSPSNNRNLHTITSPSASSYTFSSISSSVEPEFHVHQNPSQSTILNPFLYPHFSSSTPPGSGFPAQNSTTHNLFLDSGSSSHTDKDYRFFHGTRDGLDERTFFPEDSGSIRTLQDSYQQLATSSYKGYSRSQFESLADSSKKEDQQQKHCFVWGTDFKSSATRPIKLEKESETQKSMHHFFGEWPPKNSDPWLDLASSSRLHTADS